MYCTVVHCTSYVCVSDYSVRHVTEKRQEARSIFVVKRFFFPVALCLTLRNARVSLYF